MKDGEKTKIDGDTWASIRYTLSDRILHQCFTNPKLNYQVATASNLAYHYTTLDKFISILEGQSLYFTNLNYLNDRTEYNHGVDMISDVISKIMPEHPHSDILESIERNIHLIFKSSRYVACFSSNGDLLSQWRAYGNDGQGLAIGFDPMNLENVRNGIISGKYIHYKEEAQKNIIEEIIALSTNYFIGIKAQYDWFDHDYTFLVSKTIIEMLEEFISNFKHPSFEEESEFRLEYTLDGNMNKPERNAIQFRSNGRLIIPYVKLNYGEKEEQKYTKRLPIRKIILGPSLDFNLNKLSIEQLLKSMGYIDIEIVQSAIPYRL